MKHLYTLLALFALMFSAKAQTPQGFNYQAIARDSSGIILSNQNISLRTSVLSGIVRLQTNCDTQLKLI